LSLLAAEHPDIVELGGGTIRLKRLGLELGEGGLKQVNPSAPLAPLGERAATWLSAQEGVARLADALALSVQEDYVVMSGNAREHRAELLHVLFPSHWNPAERLGQDFAELHRPVAHSRPLLAASERVMRALFHKGPFIRYVWGLEAEGSLSQHPELFQRKRLPDEIAADPDRLVKTLYFRTERQTTLAMPELGRCLFTIRVTLRPLLEVLTNQERKRRLALALYSMDETLLAYKNLTRLREPLLSWLEQGFRRPVQPP
jgi:dimethylamine monooxygenase subunit A